MRLLEDFSSVGMGQRCRRCSMIVGPESVVRWVGFESEAFASNVLRELDNLLIKNEKTSGNSISY